MQDKALNQKNADRAIKRLKSILADEPEISYQELADTLNAEGYLSIKGRPFTAVNLRQIIFRLRQELRSWYHLSSRRCGFTPAVVAA